MCLNFSERRLKMKFFFNEVDVDLNLKEFAFALIGGGIVTLLIFSREILLWIGV